MLCFSSTIFSYSYLNEEQKVIENKNDTKLPFLCSNILVDKDKNAIVVLLTTKL